MLCDYAEGSKIPKGITTFNLRGDTLCKFILADAKDINVSPDTITRFQTFYWNTDQDRINFLIPYRDTVYQLSSSHSITPFMRFIKTIKINRPVFVLFLENPNGLFMGVFQKVLPPSIIGWDGWTITNRLSPISSLSQERRKHTPYPKAPEDFINDIDDGLPFCARRTNR